MAGAVGTDTSASRAESNYNYFRDYDASLDRYIESDPIGLLGGLNTYGYVFGNPLARFDQRGLDAGAISIPHPGPAIGGSIGEALGMLGRVCTKSAILFMVTGSDRGDACSDDPSHKRKECRTDRDDECEKKWKFEEGLCEGLAVQWGRAGVKLCKDSAFKRYSECLRFGPKGVTTPLHGVDTPF